MSHTVRRHLRVGADAYDEMIRRFIPGYEAMLEVAARTVANNEPGHVLDLGAGTGALSEAVLGPPGRWRGGAHRRGRGDARPGPGPTGGVRRPRALPRAVVLGGAARVRRGGHLAGAPSRAQVGGQARALPAHPRIPPPRRDLRERRCRHARRGGRPRGRLRVLGGPHGLARHPRGTRPSAISRNGPKRTPTSPSRRSWRPWRRRASTPTSPGAMDPSRLRWGGDYAVNEETAGR